MKENRMENRTVRKPEGKGPSAEDLLNKLRGVNVVVG